MELNKYYALLRTSKFLAINGCDTPDVPTFLYEYLKSTTKNDIIRLFNSVQINDKRELKRCLSGNPSEEEVKINTSLDGLIAEFIEKEMTVIWDLSDCSEEVIWNILFLNKQLEQYKNRTLKFIICGKWSKSKYLHEKPSSYPLSPAQEKYVCELFMTYCDYNSIDRIFQPLGLNEFKILIDYLGGSLYFISKYKYSVGELQHLSLDDYHEHFIYLADIYTDKIKGKTYLNFLQNDAYSKSHKVMLINTLDQEEVLGSNLFKVTTKDGAKLICQPLNFITDYTLNAITSKDSYHQYHPRRPIRYIDKDLFKDTLTIELETKHFLRQLIKAEPKIPPSNYELIINTELRENIDYRRDPPKCCREYINDRLVSDEKIWDKEDFKGNDMFDYFTFGTLPYYINVLKDLHRMKSDFDTSNYSINFIDPQHPHIIPENTLLQHSSLSKNMIVYYFILPDGKVYFAKEYKHRSGKRLSSNLTLLFSSDQRDKFSQIAEILQKIVKYRNSMAHLKILSDDTHNNFKTCEMNFYKLIASL